MDKELGQDSKGYDNYCLYHRDMLIYFNRLDTCKYTMEILVHVHYNICFVLFEQLPYEVGRRLQWRTTIITSLKITTVIASRRGGPA